jgi:hypothetical protein
MLAKKPSVESLDKVQQVLDIIMPLITLAAAIKCFYDKNYDASLYALLASFAYGRAILLEKRIRDLEKHSDFLWKWLSYKLDQPNSPCDSEEAASDLQPSC